MSGDAHRASGARATDPEVRAESLKERIYVTFTSLAVVLTLQSQPGEPRAGEAVLTLLIAVLGTLLAVLLADFLSHLIVHGRVPARAELQRMTATSLGAIGVVVLPSVLLGLAALQVWSLAAALAASTAALLGTLVLVSFLAVRRVALPGWAKAAVLLGEVALGAVVIALELFAHH